MSVMGIVGIIALSWLLVSLAVGLAFGRWARGAEKPPLCNPTAHCPQCGAVCVVQDAADNPLSYRALGDAGLVSENDWLKRENDKLKKENQEIGEKLRPGDTT